MKTEKARRPYSSSCTLDLSTDIDEPLVRAVESAPAARAWETAARTEATQDARGAHAATFEPRFARRRSRRAALADALDAWLTLLGWRSKRHPAS